MGAERAKWAIFSLAVAARCLNSLPRLAASAYHMCAHHTIPQHTIAQHTTPYHPIPYHSMPHHTFTIPANKTTPQHTTPTILTCKQYHTITYLVSPIYHTTNTTPQCTRPDLPWCTQIRNPTLHRSTCWLAGPGPARTKGLNITIPPFQERINPKIVEAGGNIF